MNAVFAMAMRIRNTFPAGMVRTPYSPSETRNSDFQPARRSSVKDSVEQRRSMRVCDDSRPFELGRE